MDISIAARGGMTSTPPSLSLSMEEDGTIWQLVIMEMLSTL